MEETMKRFLLRIFEIGKQRAPGSARELKNMVDDYQHELQKTIILNDSFP